jgi:DNA-binding transcriptional regulator YbjK
MKHEAPGTARTRSGSATRERILQAAKELFYAEGIRATSADRIIAQVGITKVKAQAFYLKDFVLFPLLHPAAALRSSRNGRGNPSPACAIMKSCMNRAW